MSRNVIFEDIPHCNKGCLYKGILGKVQKLNMTCHVQGIAFITGGASGKI
jgi:hypothetical protein